MNLSQLLKHLHLDPKFLSESSTVKQFKDLSITGLSIDSRTIQAGNLFLAYPGNQIDGRKYIEQAISNGAVAVLYEAHAAADLPFNDQINHLNEQINHQMVQIPLIPISDLQRQIGKLASTFYGYPAEKSQLIGVTGTNGKTTCTHLIAQALNLSGIPCGIIGTLGYGIPPHSLMPSGHTTPDPITLQYQLSLLTDKASIIAMEVSSHALQQKRTEGLSFHTAIFTNLSQDHLDYHQTMEAYWKAKRSLFETYPIQQAIINLDSPYGLELIQDFSHKIPMIGYTLQENLATIQTLNIPQNLPIIQAQHIRLTPKGIQAKITSPWGEGLLKSPLLGRFNLSNLLAALGALISRLNTSGTCTTHHFESQLIALSKITEIPGRMQTLGGKKQPLIVIDYAHTPDALKESLIALREHTPHKLWCIFGCGGERDVGKRPLMGRIAEQYSDQLIITDDNPRHENPEAITQDILNGLACPWAAEVEHDRKVAITHAIDCAKPGDIILLAGKGHEHYQYVLDKKIKFNDLEQAKEALAAKHFVEE